MTWHHPDPHDPEDASWAAVHGATLEIAGCLKINPLFGASMTTTGVHAEKLVALMTRPLYHEYLPYIVHYWMNQVVAYAPGTGLLMNPPGDDDSGQQVRELIGMSNQQILAGISLDEQVTYLGHRMAQLDTKGLADLMITVALLMTSALQSCRATPPELIKTLQVIGAACGEQLPDCVVDNLIKAVMYARADADRRDCIWPLLVSEIEAERGWTVDSGLGGAVGSMVALLADSRKKGWTPSAQVTAMGPDDVPDAVVDLASIDPTPPPAAGYKRGGDTLWAGGMLWQLMEHAMRGQVTEQVALLKRLECTEHRVAVLAVATRWMRDLLAEVKAYIPA